MKENISKYGVSGLLILSGLVIIISTVVPPAQNGLIFLGGFALLSVGAVALLTAMEIINQKLQMPVSLGLGVLVVILGYFNYRSIQEPIDFNNKKTAIYAKVIQRLKDIREAEVAFKNEYNTYTGSFDSLGNFLKNDSVSVVKMFGAVPDGMTEEQALDSGIVRRDTSRIPAFDYVYSDEYLETRIKSVELHPDSLSIIPVSGKQFDLDAGIVEKNNIRVPVFKVEDSAPFDEKDPMMVGSMKDPSTSGNWKEEK